MEFGIEIPRTLTASIARVMSRNAVREREWARWRRRQRRWCAGDVFGFSYKGLAYFRFYDVACPDFATDFCSFAVLCKGWYINVCTKRQRGVRPVVKSSDVGV